MGHSGPSAVIADKRLVAQRPRSRMTSRCGSWRQRKQNWGGANSGAQHAQALTSGEFVRSRRRSGQGWRASTTTTPTSRNCYQFHWLQVGKAGRKVNCKRARVVVRFMSMGTAAVRGRRFMESDNPGWSAAKGHRKRCPRRSLPLAPFGRALAGLYDPCVMGASKRLHG
jgi:hypothetical protein